MHSNYHSTSALARLATALLAACLLIVSGCASTPKAAKQGPATPPLVNTQTGVVTGSGSQATAPSPTGTSQTPASPQHLTNLWTRIDIGFELQPNTQQPLVQKWIKYYTSHQRHLDSAARRARPFLWHIVSALDERNMPMEIALLPIVESGFKAHAVSYSSATGIWQFMPATAKRFGLSKNWWHDGRSDVLASTDAALNYLQYLYSRYNNWLLALAAYNAGGGTINRARAKAEAQGKPQDFWHLNLSRETTNYVPKLLALRALLNQPVKYGYHWPTIPNRPVTELVTLPNQISLKVAAGMMDMPVDKLKFLNPGLRRNATAPTGDHPLLVPTDRAGNLRAALTDASADDLMPRAIRVALKSARNRSLYTVRRGETLSGIASRFGTSVAQIRRANSLGSSIIYPGQRLTIAGAATTGVVRTRHYTVRSGDSLSVIAHRHGVSVKQLRRWNGLSTRSVLQPDQVLTIQGGQAQSRTIRYTVVSGDSLWHIAKSHGVSVASLARANNLSRNATLQPGQVLTIHGAGSKVYTYTVATGDSLWRIAHSQNVRVAELAHWNHLSTSTTLRPGQKLTIHGAAPSNQPVKYTVKSGDSLWRIAHGHGVSVAAVKKWNHLGNNTTLQPGQTLVLRGGAAQRKVIYHVQAGDSLWSIAHSFNVRVAQIKTWNNLSTDTLIHPGQTLRIITTSTG